MVHVFVHFEIAKCWQIFHSPIPMSRTIDKVHFRYLLLLFFVSCTLEWVLRKIIQWNVFPFAFLLCHVDNAYNMRMEMGIDAKGFLLFKLIGFFCSSCECLCLYVPVHCSDFPMNPFFRNELFLCFEFLLLWLCRRRRLQRTCNISWHD